MGLAATLPNEAKLVFIILATSTIRKGKRDPLNETDFSAPPGQSLNTRCHDLARRIRPSTPVRRYLPSCHVGNVVRLVAQADRGPVPTAYGRNAARGQENQAPTGKALAQEEVVKRAFQLQQVMGLRALKQVIAEGATLHLAHVDAQQAIRTAAIGAEGIFSKPGAAVGPAGFGMRRKFWGERIAPRQLSRRAGDGSALSVVVRREAPDVVSTQSARGRASYRCPIVGAAPRRDRRRMSYRPNRPEGGPPTGVPL